MVRATVVLLIAIVAAPGCVMIHGPAPVNEERVSAPHKEPFADLITAPGQRYSISSTPAPIEGTIPSSPPAPLNIRTGPTSTVPPTPRPVDEIPPAKPKENTPAIPQSNPPGESPQLNSLYPPPLSANQKADTPFIAAARAFEDGRSDFGQEQLRPLPMAKQELLSKILPAAAKTAAGNLNDPHEVNEIISRLESAVDQLRSRSELKIDVLLLASTYTEFGEYNVIPPNTSLRPGQVVKLYSEPKWTAPEVIFKNGQAYYTVIFDATMRIRSSNAVVYEFNGKFRLEPRSQRNNIFVPIEFSAPTKPGVYTVELELTDVHGRRAKRSLDFAVEDRK